MSIKSLGLAALAAASLAVAAPASAAVITPVGVTASNTFPFWGIYDASHLIDGSGLSGGLHDATFSNMWMTDLGVDNAVLTFDLGGAFKLSGLSVWNYNFGTEGYASTLDRAAKAFTVSVSTDGVNYVQVLGGNLSRGTGNLLAAETFGLSGLARYVQIGLNGNHQQDPQTYGYAPVGLSEVRFSGSAVPEPATWAMMIAGFGLAGVALRSRRMLGQAA
ncbi:PEPxxWA-CTERM sorting domain-containing protein [Phenylobacterium sp.]|jgi:hypothetical protein|uniref:PEPxxWA-CTERM sorting domain-containing protein n=1 Tax=Phenylobacterium sp. TaxID=1871053 RepID=UPI0035B13488